MQEPTFTAISYEDDEIVIAGENTYDSKEEAVLFAKTHNWDRVVNDATGEVVWWRR